MDEGVTHSHGFASDNGVSEVVSCLFSPSPFLNASAKREPSAPDKGKDKAKAEPDNVGNSEDNSEVSSSILPRATQFNHRLGRIRGQGA
jgi:hypothetical protein